MNEQHDEPLTRVSNPSCTVDDPLLISDTWLADQVAARVRDRLRFVGALRRRFVWDGARWKRDDMLEGQREISEALSEIALVVLARFAANPSAQRIARVIESWRKLRDVMDLVRVHPTILTDDVSSLDAALGWEGTRGLP